MKVEPSAISRSALADHLRDSYRLSSPILAFVPQGEDAYAYRVAAAGGELYFVRIQPPLVISDAALDHALDVVDNALGVVSREA